MKKLSLKTNIILTVCFIAIVAGLLGFVDNFGGSYISRIVSLIGVYGIMAVSLTLINGISGIFSLGHAGFMAIGAYVSALLTMSAAQKESTFIMEPIISPLNQPMFSDVNFFIATLAGGIVAAIFAYLIGWASLRMAGDYLAITTMGFGEIIRITALNTTPVTNGALGLKGIPSYTNIWTSWFWLLITVIVIASLAMSTFGRAMRAIRDDKIAAESMGINVFKHELYSFVVGGFFAGIAGALYAHWLTTLDPKPTTIGIMLTFNALIMIVLGGLGSISGAIFGAAFFAFFSEWLRFIESDMDIFGFIIPGISGMRVLVFSVIFVLIMIFRPQGLMGNKELSWNSIYRFFKYGRGGKKWAKS